MTKLKKFFTNVLCFLVDGNVQGGEAKITIF